MNALPINEHQTPRGVIDDLIADFGFKPVVLAVLARVFRRTRPPDSESFEDLSKQPGVDSLSNHLRKDLGLPPSHRRDLNIDLLQLNKRDYF